MGSCITCNRTSWKLAQGQLQPDLAKIRPVEGQLQRFLSFANFYRTLIQAFSKVTTSLTSLTSTNTPFTWTPWSLHHTPALQFMLEVDTSDSGDSVVPS